MMSNKIHTNAGRFVSKLWYEKDCSKIQILTVQGLLNAAERVDAPLQPSPFAIAAHGSAMHKQMEML